MKTKMGKINFCMSGTLHTNQTVGIIFWYLDDQGRNINDINCTIECTNNLNGLPKHQLTMVN